MSGDLLWGFEQGNMEIHMIHAKSGRHLFEAEWF